jgi:hypothetical protein
MIAEGQRESHHLSDDDLAAYLLARPGIQPGWDPAELADLVSEPGRR